MIGFPTLVEMELTEARRNHKRPHNSAHEGYAVLLEEVNELWDEVRKPRDSRSPFRMLGELVQIGAMAQRVAEDVLRSATETIPADVKLFTDGEEIYGARSVDEVLKHIGDVCGLSYGIPKREDVVEIPREQWAGRKYRLESGESCSLSLAVYIDLLGGEEMPWLIASSNC